MLILLLENNPAEADRLRSTLSEGEIPCGVLCVETRADFLAAIERGGFDVLLTDLDGVPDIDGLSAMSYLLERHTGIPCLLYTDASHEDRAIEALNNGAADYILREKMTRLIPVVKRALREREIHAAHTRAEAQIHYLSRHDTLTGLPNRVQCQDRIAEAMREAAGERRRMAVLLVDLDRFTVINDSLGHSLGNQLLKAVTERLRRTLRPGDVLARMGGDKFMVILPRIETSDDVVWISQNMLRTLRPPFMLEHHELFVTASVGSAVYPDDAADSETLARNAHLAMYQAKSHGCDNHHHYAPGMDDGTQERLVIETQLHHALDRGELLVYYQPQVDLRTGSVVGVEALLRWRHPRLGMISPAQFIPVAETSGQIVPIGLWALQTACVQGKTWQESGFPALRIAVNLSPRQFQQSDLYPQIAGILKETGFESHQLDLELTESVDIFSCDRSYETLVSLKNMGIQITMDDFGTGYSSLSYLKRFSIDTLKIDLMFVRDLTTAPSASAIARGIITMGHSLDMTIIAEGVETEEQLAILRQQGCDQIQGYLFSPPVPADAIERMLIENRHLSGTHVVSGAGEETRP